MPENETHGPGCDAACGCEWSDVAYERIQAERDAAAERAWRAGSAR